MGWKRRPRSFEETHKEKRQCLLTESIIKSSEIIDEKERKKVV